MNKIVEKLIDLVIEKYSVTRERSRDCVSTSIEDIEGFKKELKEVINLYYEPELKVNKHLYRADTILLNSEGINERDWEGFEERMGQ